MNGNRMSTKALIQSYVHYNDKVFFVSTINRESSSPYAAGTIYAETMVWEYKNNARGEILAQSEATEDSLEGHFNMCKLLAKLGVCEYSDED
jgi:hypothetical protein